MRRISRECWTDRYDADQPFVAELHPGERIVVEVGRGSRIPTGPIGVPPAKPGDALVVHVHDVRIRPDVGGGMNVNSRPGRGFAGERIAELRAETHSRPLEIAGEWIVFNERIRIPLRPSVGVVGTQPLGVKLPTIWPWRHGGNLDCHDVVPGTKVYLPVATDGAGLIVGDIHAAIGDGEVMISGAEVAGEITLSVDLCPGRGLTWPFVETEAEIMALGSARTLEAAATIAIEELAGLLRLRRGLAFEQAVTAINLAGAVRVCQIVNPLVTVRAVIPKSVVPGIFV